jgi:integrase
MTDAAELVHRQALFAPVAVSADMDPYLVYLGRLSSAESRRTMAGCLDRIARLLLQTDPRDPSVTGSGIPWGNLRYPHTALLRSMLLAQGWSAAHVNKHLIALRMVLKEAWRLGLMSAENCQRASDLQQVKGQREPAGRMLRQAEIAALLDSCSGAGTTKGARDAALIAVAYCTGGRRSELVGMDLRDWDTADGVRLTGKGNKIRRVPIASWATSYLNGWLRARGNRPGPLFTRVTKAGRVTRHPISGQTVADILAARTLDVGGRTLSPHDLRRTLISTMLDDPLTDLVIVQRIAGHASPATTARYDRRPHQAAQMAIDRLPDPHIREAPTTSGKRQRNRDADI